MEAALARKAIADYFGASRVSGLAAFRALCNVLKALVIERAVQARRQQPAPAAEPSTASAPKKKERSGPDGSATAAATEPRPGRRGLLDVVDVGCGKGGDLWKWSHYRLRSYLGLDGSERCVAEARARQAQLLSQGLMPFPASFEVRDLCASTGLTPNSADVVTAQFFLQYVFESERVARSFLGDVARALRPGGVLAGIVPDGDRVHALLRPEDPRPVPFGHFWLSRCGAARSAEAGPGGRYEGPYGRAYHFALTDDGCPEYFVPPLLLESLLEECGFEPLEDGGSCTEAAQHFYAAAPRREAVEAPVLQGQRCSEMDWTSLGLFRVLLARKRQTLPASASSSLRGEEGELGPSSSSRSLAKKSSGQEPLSSSSGREGAASATEPAAPGAAPPRASHSV